MKTFKQYITMNENKNIDQINKLNKVYADWDKKLSYDSQFPKEEQDEHLKKEAKKAQNAIKKVIAYIEDIDKKLSAREVTSLVAKAMLDSNIKF